MPPKSKQLGPGSLKIGETATPREFAAQLTKTALTPNVDFDDDIPTLDGGVAPGDATETWELSGTLLQDYDLDSLEDYCFEHKLTQLPFVFTPNSSASRSYSGVVTIVPITVGGDVKKRNTSDFTFPVVGSPTPIETAEIGA